MAKSALSKLTPREYVLESVLPEALEFKENRTNRGKARAACIAAYHLTDYLKGGNTGVETAIKQINEDAYEVVRAIANAGKHTETTGKKYPHKYHVIAGHEFPRPPAYFGQFMFGVSCFGDKHGDILIGDKANKAAVYHNLRVYLKAVQKAFPGELSDVDFSVLDD